LQPVAEEVEGGEGPAGREPGRVPQRAQPRAAQAQAFQARQACARAAVQQQFLNMRGTEARQGGDRAWCGTGSMGSPRSLMEQCSQQEQAPMHSIHVAGRESNTRAWEPRLVQQPPTSTTAPVSWLPRRGQAPKCRPHPKTPLPRKMPSATPAFIYITRLLASTEPTELMGRTVHTPLRDNTAQPHPASIPGSAAASCSGLSSATSRVRLDRASRPARLPSRLSDTTKS
jgi:hypothetical protein